MKENTYKIDRLTITAPFPIEFLLEMKITQGINEHGRLVMTVYLSEEAGSDYIFLPLEGEFVKVVDNAGNNLVVLFYGSIEKSSIEKNGNVFKATIYVASLSISLDKEKKNRVFQNISFTYDALVNEVLGSNVNLLWHEESGKKIGAPIIQYEETDWQFLLRLASHFNTVIYADVAGEIPGVGFGISPRIEHNLTEALVIESGFSDTYFTEGGYEAGKPRNEYSYIELCHQNTDWEIRDYIRYRNIPHVIIKRITMWEKGMLSVKEIAASNGLYYRKKRYNNALVSLNGIIDKVENETVYVKIDIDPCEALYAWQWVPEIGNLCYIMPEVGSKVVLAFPEHKENNGIAVCLLRDGGPFLSEQHRELTTKYNKKMGLYPDKLVLETKDSSSRINLTDADGILIADNNNINIEAKGDIYISGSELAVTSPLNITLRTNASNIEICRDFNIYAPNGLKKIPTSNGAPKKDSHRSESPSNWLSSYAALGAIPSVASPGFDDKVMASTCFNSAIPQVATGTGTYALSEILTGKTADEVTFPQALSNMSAYTLNGGYPLPKDI